MEKAWAKLHGSYCTIVGGFPMNVLRDLTGAPSYSYALKDAEKDDLWNKVLQGEKNGWCIAIDTPGQGENTGDTGIISGHAYSVLGAYTVTDKYGHPA